MVLSNPFLGAALIGSTYFSAERPISYWLRAASPAWRQPGRGVLANASWTAIIVAGAFKPDGPSRDGEFHSTVDGSAIVAGSCIFHRSKAALPLSDKV